MMNEPADGAAEPAPPSDDATVPGAEAAPADEVVVVDVAAQRRSLTARVARLDADGTYWGLGDAVSLDMLKAGDFVFGDPAIAGFLPDGVIHVERDCDLPVGRYRLEAPNATSRCWSFSPLELPKQKTQPGAPTLEQAMRDLVKNGAQGAVVQAWLKSYEEATQ